MFAPERSCAAAVGAKHGRKPNGPLGLRVYPGPDCKGSLYQDDGHTLAYEKGEFLRVSYSCQVGADAIRIVSTIEKDSYKPWWSAAESRYSG